MPSVDGKYWMVFKPICWVLAVNWFISVLDEIPVGKECLWGCLVVRKYKFVQIGEVFFAMHSIARRGVMRVNSRYGIKPKSNAAMRKRTSLWLRV